MMFINRHTNKLTLLSGVLILFGVLFKVLNFSLTSDILLIIATAVAFLPIFLKAYSSTRMKQFSIELLVVIAIIGAIYIKEYIESSVVSFLFLFGAYLEAKTLEKMRNSLDKLTSLAPKEALVLRDGIEETISVNKVVVDDLVILKAGTVVPVDGVVINGDATINEASITGESVPVLKDIGSEVYSGSIVLDGYLTFRSTKVGRDTTFNKMINLIEEASESKTQAQKFLDKFASIYTPLIAVLSLLVYLFTKDLHLSITFLVVACPGALVIGAPVSTVSGIARGARMGVLIKGGEAVNNLAKTNIFVFDKTGTLTVGRPEVNEFIDFKATKDPLLYLGSLEQASEHHLARAIVNYTNDQNITLSEDVKDINVIRGYGISGLVNELSVLIGNVELMENNNIKVSSEIKETIKKYEALGNTTILLSVENKLSGLVSISDQVKDEAKGALKNLKPNKTVMLTGDNELTALKVSEELGIDYTFASLKPEDKVEKIKELQSKGYKVAFVGDGLNDAPALKLSDSGISMGISSVEVSRDISDVVIMNDNLDVLVDSVSLAKKTRSNMIQNMLIAIITVIILLIGVVFKKVNLAIGMFVHEGSILVVILNGMRLLRFKNKEK